MIAGTVRARPRTQAALAIAAAEGGWHLVNATPDIGTQLRQLVDGAPPPVVRHNPVVTVLLTDAELDHAAGLLSLREGSNLTVYATEWVHRATAMLQHIIAAYVPVDRCTVRPGKVFPLDERLACEAVPTGSTKRPRYAAQLAPGVDGTVIGLRFTDRRTGRALLYLPCLPALTDELRAAIDASACVLLDGTCWTDDEMAAVGRPDKTSRSMGHAPVTGPGGTLAELAEFSGVRRIYTHLNNTNPLLVEDSPERARVEAAGVEVAYDGMEIEV